MKATLFATLLLFFVESGYTQSLDTCELLIKVDNIRLLKGKIKLALYDHEDRFLKTAVTWGDLAIVDHSLVYSFKGLKQGIYAVSIFQDENENGKLDANFFGIPTEPYGFSNNAKGMFGPPSFKDCQFEIVGAYQEIAISL